MKLWVSLKCLKYKGFFGELTALGAVLLHLPVENFSQDLRNHHGQIV
jgi:hypothetical protein